MYKYKKQKDYFDQYTATITVSTGTVLRVDHTYKIASALSAYDPLNKKRVSYANEIQVVYSVTCTPGANQGFTSVNSKRRGTSSVDKAGSIR